ncbi:MAG: DUF3524 domain-containing protein [bacterium]
MPVISSEARNLFVNILIIEPYLTGSHKAWAEGYQKHSRHRIDLLSLPGNFWKWRMHGGAVTLAREFLCKDLKPDVLLVTDMLDLTTFLALTRKKTTGIATAVYFHENQLAYPWSPQDRDVQKSRDSHYGFINYTTALAADRVFFNSSYNQKSFLNELQRFLKHFPDHKDLRNVERIRAKSTVLPLGLDLARFDRHKREARELNPKTPLVLWNHRWEFDKNPGEFFKALFRLADKGLDFEVALLGECFSRQPEAFLQARERLGARIVHFGYCEGEAEYASWLWRADLLPVTSNQDFFGASVAEAIACGCHPILPRRLAYPELIPAELHNEILYDTFDELLNRLEAAIVAVVPKDERLARAVRQFDWQTMAQRYDDAFQRMI